MWTKRPFQTTVSKKLVTAGGHTGLISLVSHASFVVPFVVHLNRVLALIDMGPVYRVSSGLSLLRCVM